MLPPTPVRALDLVGAVWPEQEEPRPETLLYALMGERSMQHDLTIA